MYFLCLKEEYINMANRKLFSLKLSAEEDQRLGGLAALTNMTKSAVLKQNLYPAPIFEERIIYEALKRIDSHLNGLNEKSQQAIRKEMMDLCISLNALTRKKGSDTMTSKTCKPC